MRREPTAGWPTAARDLWQRIARHELDVDGAALPFTARLARDNSWSRRFAARVVEEYRRFTFLAVVAGHPVTPSDQVDQAWHLHLLYTRDYWQVFCAEVLGRELHHGPTAGGPAQGALFDEQYSRTRHSYLTWFGEHPPVDIWPDAATRFGRDTRWVRVNRDDVHLLPRLRLRTALLGIFVLLALAAGCTLAPDSRPDSIVDANGNPYALSAGAFLRFFALACAVVIAVTAVIGRRLWRTAVDRGVGAMPEGVYETAMLCGGAPRVQLVLVAELVQRGEARIARGKLVPMRSPSSTAHPLLRALYAETGGQPVGRRRLQQALGSALDGPLAELRRVLEAKGLLAPRGEVPNWPTVVAALFPLLFALPRVVPALAARRPIGYLAVLAIVAVVLAWSVHVAVWRRYRRLTTGGLAAQRRLEPRVHDAGAKDERLLETA
ncbi:MAG: TIGR04222 domain-containing membrane protein, partial [Planctomycetes bacterium]|nr:TIGR04222 domain-containing membrane protein [Planctomycetota bacterium]